MAGRHAIRRALPQLLRDVSVRGVASGPSAHLFVASGSSLSQNTHFNSVRPLKLGAGTILLPQCKQRHSVHGNLPNLLLNHLETLVPT